MTTSRRRLGRTSQQRVVNVKTLASLEAECIAHHRALGRSENTIHHYQDSFRLMDAYLADAGIDPTSEVLTTQTFQGLAAYLRRTPTRGFRGSTERTIHGIHGIMKDWRAFCRWALEEDLIEALPKVPVPRLPQHLFPVLTETELATIFNSKQLDVHTEIGKRNRAMIAFMLDTGVRLAEVTGLGIDDLNLREGMAKVRGKGNKERMVFYSSGVTDGLKKWLAIRGDGPGTLFWLAPDGVRMVLERIKKETGLPLLHAHQLRHTAATMMVRQHADLHTVKRILGHSQLSTVEWYLSLDNTDLKDKHTSASPFEKIRSTIEPETLRGRRRLKAS